ncbi:MAG TPA: TolC family protein, partial [Chitinophagaceae bacterium]|nr:TolC family protein [Chitinophagaceae bacterium]
VALKNNFDIQLAKNNVDIANINNNYGVAGGLPEVSGTASDNEQVTDLTQKLASGTSTKRTGVTNNALSAGVTGTILLYNGMRVVATKNRLEELHKQSEQLLNAQIQNTIAAVMTQYYDVVRQQSYMKTLDASVAAAQQRLEIVQQRLNVGYANNADLFQSQLDLNALLQTKQSQQLVIDQSKTDLLTLMNVNADSVIAINDTIIADKYLIQDSVLSNIQNNPLITAAAQQIKINQLIEKETAAQRYPSLRLNTGYNYNRSQSSAGFILLNQTYGPFINLGVTVPIYNGSVYKRQQQVAQINIRNAQLQKETIIRDNTSAAVKNFQAYKNALQQAETEQQNYDLSKKLLDLVLQKFQLRQATIVDVKQAQQSFEDAGFRLVNLSFAAKAAEIELKRLTNTLSF